MNNEDNTFNNSNFSSTDNTIVDIPQEVTTTSVSEVSEPHLYENDEKTTVIEENVQSPTEQVETSVEQTTSSTSQAEASTEQTTPSYDTYHYSNDTDFYTSPENEPLKKKKSKFPSFLKWAAKAACFGIIAGTTFFGINYFCSKTFGVTPLETSFGSTETPIGNGTALNITLGSTSVIEGAENPAESVVVQVVEQNMPATVAVKSTFLNTYSYWGQQYQRESQGSGSGFIVGMNDKELLIATNNHVIEDATKIEITFIDDAVLEATVKGTDSIADLAIIAVPLNTISAETLSKIRVATLGDSNAVRLGEMAIAIGNALGYGQSVTVGYISAKDREVTVDGNIMVLLQTDAAINGGNSGGPLFNTRGEVIGINSVKYADTDVEGMCFAIPISRATPILSELMNRETLTEDEKGFLGVSTRTVTEDIASFYGWPTGAYIVSVQEGSPAETAGIYVADIVTSVNGVQITNADQLVSAVSGYRYGTTIELKVQRLVNGKYEEVTLQATLAKKSDMVTPTPTPVPTSTNPQNGFGNFGQPNR